MAPPSEKPVQSGFVGMVSSGEALARDAHAQALNLNDASTIGIRIGRRGKVSTTRQEALSQAPVHRLLETLNEPTARWTRRFVRAVNGPHLHLRPDGPTEAVDFDKDTAGEVCLYQWPWHAAPAQAVAKEGVLCTKVSKPPRPRRQHPELTAF